MPLKTACGFSGPTAEFAFRMRAAVLSERCHLWLHGDPAAHAAVAEADRRHALITYGETAVDTQMRQVVMPVLRRWGGVPDATTDAAAGQAAT